jgi:hypothetical protein
MEFGESDDEVIVVGRTAPSLPRGKTERRGMGYSLRHRAIIIHTFL